MIAKQNEDNYRDLEVQNDIDFCRHHFPAENFEFIHLDVANPAYAPDQKGEPSEWPIENESVDLEEF